jgi:hypothetical protein
MKRFFPLILLSPLLALAAEKKIELPAEPMKFKEGKGSELAMAYCYTCHSVEYIATQPPMPRKFWEATVLKMRDKFGAPLPEESVQPLIDYLTAAYGKN